MGKQVLRSLPFFFLSSFWRSNNDRHGLQHHGDDDCILNRSFSKNVIHLWSMITNIGKQRRLRRPTRRSLTSPHKSPLFVFLHFKWDRSVFTVTVVEHSTFSGLLQNFHPLYGTVTRYSNTLIERRFYQNTAPSLLLQVQASNYRCHSLSWAASWMTQSLGLYFCV